MINKEERLFNERPTFNMAVLFLTRLDDRNNDCDQAFLEGNLLRVYRGLRNIYLMVKFKVMINPQKELLGSTYIKHLDNIDTAFSKVSQLLTNTKTASMNLSQTEKELDKIREMLYSFLWDLNFIFPEKFKIKWQDEVRSDFE